MKQVEKAAVRTETSVDAAATEIKACNFAIYGVAGDSIPRATVPGMLPILENLWMRI